MQRHRWAALAVLLCVTSGARGASVGSVMRRHLSRLASGHTWQEFTDPFPAPIPTTEQQRDGFIVFQRSVLARVYPQSHPHPGEVVSVVAIDAVRDEYEPAQLAVYPLRDLQQMAVTVSDLVDDAREVLPASQVTVRMVRYYGAEVATGRSSRFAVVPKTLEIAVPLNLKAGAVRAYWISVHVPAQQTGGRYRGTITFRHLAGTVRLPLTLAVTPVTLQEPDVLYGTLCVNALANLSKWIRGDSDSALTGRALQRAETLARQADRIFDDERAHGMTSMSLRSVDAYQERDGQPFLPDLELTIDLYKKYRFTQPLVYCLGHLLKTNKINRSNSYREFDASVHVPMARKIVAYYTQRFRDAGLPGIIFMPVEEPNLRDGIAVGDPPNARQTLARELMHVIREAGGATALTCTPDSVTSSIDFLDYWIVAYRRFSPDLYERVPRPNGRLCVYANATVMGEGTYFTRFLFGYFTWANRLQGMVPWTYPLLPKRFPRNVDGRGEGALNISEGFLGLDDRPVPTIQWELAREGVDDAKYLHTIEVLAQRARASAAPTALHAADEAESFLADIRRSVDRDIRHYTFTDTKTFEPTSQDGWTAQRFHELREHALALLAKLSDSVP